MPLATIIGILAGSGGMIGFIPQVVHVIRTGSVGDLSLGMVWIQSVSMSLWVWYGMLVDNGVIIGFNAAKVALLTVLLGYFARDYWFRKPLKISDALSHPSKPTPYDLDDLTI